jgi:hypothetical protein
VTINYGDLYFVVCYSKPAQLEGLEVDQYMWAILSTLSSSDVDEVTIDAAANWKPAKSLQGIKVRKYYLQYILIK